MSVAVTRLVDCRPWSDMQRELLRQRSAVAQAETFDFLTWAERQGHSNDELQSHYARFYLQRITKDMFKSWIAMRNEDDTKEILTRQYFLDFACTTGYWRFRGLSYLATNGQWQCFGLEPVRPEVILPQIETMVSVPQAMVDQDFIPEGDSPKDILR